MIHCLFYKFVVAELEYQLNPIHAHTHTLTHGVDMHAHSHSFSLSLTHGVGRYTEYLERRKGR